MTQPQIFLVLQGVWPCQVPPADPGPFSAGSGPPCSWESELLSGRSNMVSMFPSVVGQIFRSLKLRGFCYNLRGNYLGFGLLRVL